MASTTNLQTKSEHHTNSEFLKCLAEGMHEWLQVKEQTCTDINPKTQSLLDREIDLSCRKATPLSLPNKIVNKMKSLGIKRNMLIEFKGVFKSDSQNAH